MPNGRGKLFTLSLSKGGWVTHHPGFDKLSPNGEGMPSGEGKNKGLGEPFTLSLSKVPSATRSLT